MIPQLQRLLARGEGTLPRTCIIDVGAIGRWMRDAASPTTGSNPWASVVQALSGAPRHIIWFAALPGRTSRVFGDGELQAAVQQLRQLGVQHLVDSTEPLTSIFAPERSRFASGAPVPLSERTAVVGAQIDAYPEQLFVLEGAIDAVLDVGTGVTHTYWSQYRDRRGEPVFIPLVQAAATGDPQDPRGRPLGGNAAPRYTRDIDGLYQGAAHPDAKGGYRPRLPRYILDSLSKNSLRLQHRAREIVGTGRDVGARAQLKRALEATIRSQATLAVSDPIVVVAVNSDVNGNLKLVATSCFVLLGTTQHEVTTEGALQAMLIKLVKSHPGNWIAPCALDLLGYMADHDIPLPKSVVDPAHCAFVLSPDSPELAVGACPTASRLTSAVAHWLWDDKRKAPAPKDLSELRALLPQLMVELRSQVRARGLDALVDDDIARTVPVLASMERRGAWVHADSTGIGALLETEMGGLEKFFRPLLGDLPPYEASPKEIVRVLDRRGVSLPDDRALPGADAADLFERLASVDARVDALRKARTLSNVQRWMSRLDDANGRLRGRHFLEVSGRWGMNSDALQAMPKHSRGAKAMRQRLAGPPGMRLLSADFSSFELRLVAGLSRGPLLLQAAQQRDAIDHLARHYFGSAYSKQRRAEMKRYLHPLNYGTEEWGFIRQQASIPTADAAQHYQQLRQLFSALFTWRTSAVAAAQVQGFARTTGGWQRDPRLAPASGKKAGPHWYENAVISTLVQGLAADIQRWCLRELARVLPQYDAELVFQNHDEIYVAVKKYNVKLVRDEVQWTLEQRVRSSRLLPQGIRLVVRMREGATWADLV